MATEGDVELNELFERLVREGKLDRQGNDLVVPTAPALDHRSDRARADLKHDRHQLSGLLGGQIFWE
jgi:hypothetical protein